MRKLFTAAAFVAAALLVVGAGVARADDARTLDLPRPTWLTDLRARYDPGREIVNISGKLVRSADDIRRRRPPQDFKGAADCVSGRPMLIVWSM